MLNVSHNKPFICSFTFRAALVTLTCVVRGLCVNVPEAHCRVPGAAGEVFAVRTELDGDHRLSVARQRAEM